MNNLQKSVYIHSTNEKEHSVVKVYNRMIDKKYWRSFIHNLFSLYRFITLFCIGVIILYPIMSMLSITFRPISQLTDPLVVWIPRSLTLENIKMAWNRIDFTNSTFNSLVVTIGSSILQLISCSLTGYGFARFNFKGKSWLFVIVLFTILVPPQTIIIPRYLQFWQFDFLGIGSLVKLLSGKQISVNILGTYFTMFVPAGLGVGIRGGLFIYIFRQFFRGMPTELEDAAYIDGCGPFSAFVQVMAPSAGVAFITVFIFSSVWYWNDYLHTNMFMGGVSMISPSLMMLNSKLALEMSQIQNLESNPYRLSAALQAGCLLASAPLLIMYSFLQKYFTESIERTGIVG